MHQVVEDNNLKLMNRECEGVLVKKELPQYYRLRLEDFYAIRTGMARKDAYRWPILGLTCRAREKK